MKGPWKVTSNILDGQKMYAVYRLIDVDEVDHSGNREFATDYIKSKEKAVAIAQELNVAAKMAAEALERAAKA